MSIFLAIEDSQKVGLIIAAALKQAGYILCDEQESAGLIKIIKKDSSVTTTSLTTRIFEVRNLLLKEKEGFLYKSMMEDIERPLLESVLKRVDGNRSKAAKILGINRNTLSIKLKKFNINPNLY